MVHDFFTIFSVVTDDKHVISNNNENINIDYYI